jgi:hypothetical protein
MAMGCVLERDAVPVEGSDGGLRMSEKPMLHDAALDGTRGPELEDGALDLLVSGETAAYALLKLGYARMHPENRLEADLTHHRFQRILRVLLGF